MKVKTRYILIIVLTLIITDVSAQNSQVGYFMNLPQNHMLNPALRPSNSVYVGLPGISGINMNINNNYVNFSDILMNDQASDSVFSFMHTGNNNATVNSFLSKIKDRNFIEPEIMTQLLGVGFAVGENSYFFLDINERAEGNFVIPGDLFRVALSGNESFVGSTIDLSSLRASMMYYHEIGLGFSRNFTDKLRIGVKGKLLFGVGTMKLENRALGITVNDDYSHSLAGDLTFDVSAPVKIYTSNENIIDSVNFDDNSIDAGYLSGTGNLGLGLDIGATYDLTDRITLSAAVTDLGFIKWKNDVSNVSLRSQFDFSGLDMLDVINGTKTLDELGTEMADSLKNSVNIKNSSKSFTTFLPSAVTLGGSYTLNRYLTFGLLSYTRFIGKQVREALTMSANASLGNVLSASLSYTMTNHRYDNLGAGLAVRAGWAQFYVMTDRIPVTWNRIKSDNSDIILPASWNTINLRLGMNLVFGNRVKTKKDKPMVTVQ
ncbi:MAG TPA: DUF5723 family protein [Bacteroidales bacterium]|nr:DUF5723 family protein [Bacteroidales bacterium]